jgi:hypothetical protein
MTKRTNILIIGMLDSIHVARWLSQFCDQDLDFTLVASQRYRKLHPGIHALVDGDLNASYRIHTQVKTHWLMPFWDYFRFELVSKVFPFNSRSNALESLMTCTEFDFVHGLEIQGAGYLLNEVSEEILHKSEFILTNWGSDIYFYIDYPDHKKTIIALLKKVNRYSAECIRDYKLARQLGFKGIELPCIPNAGGFEFQNSEFPYLKPSMRKQIILKGYGGKFGRAGLILELLPIIVQRFPEFSFFIYSVTPELITQIKKLPVDVKNRIRFVSINKKMAHKDILQEFRRSRIYIGCSVSDGISTSFLESLYTGAFPIQTNTSCMSEWVSLGCLASEVSLNSEEILMKISEALSKDEMVDSASLVNYRIARQYLNRDTIREKALSFYT